MSEPTITLRTYQESDAGLIYSSWPKGAYYGRIEPIELPKEAWFERFYHYMQDCLAHETVLVACLSDDPSIILGYAIYRGTTLEWVYVKEAFRKQGIAKLLTLNRTKRVRLDHLTRVGSQLLSKLKLEKPNERKD